MKSFLMPVFEIPADEPRCSGGHPACRRGLASRRPEKYHARPIVLKHLKRFCIATHLSAGLEAPTLRQAGCPPLQSKFSGGAR